MPTEKDPPISINIGNICNGAAVELFDIAVAKVLKNIADPNTSGRFIAA